MCKREGSLRECIVPSSPSLPPFIPSMSFSHWSLKIDRERSRKSKRANKKRWELARTFLLSRKEVTEAVFGEDVFWKTRKTTRMKEIMDVRVRRGNRGKDNPFDTGYACMGPSEASPCIFTSPESSFDAFGTIKRLQREQI